MKKKAESKKTTFFSKGVDCRQSSFSDHLLGKKVGSEYTCTGCAAIRGTKCASLCEPMGEFQGITVLTVNGKTAVCLPLHHEENKKQNVCVAFFVVARCTC